MALLSDWIRVPKSVDAAKHATRWYMHKTTGQMVSRWQYQTMQAGGLNPAARAELRREYGIVGKREGKIKHYQDIVKRFREKEALRLNTSPSKIKVRGKSESAQQIKNLYRMLKNLTNTEKKDKSPQGKLAQILVGLGLRNPEWDMPVGESPK